MSRLAPISTLLVGACVQTSPIDPNAPFDPAVVYVSARFATDDGRAVPTLDSDPTLTLTLVDDRFFNDDDSADRLCTLTLTTPGPIDPDDALVSDADSLGLFTAFRWPQDATAEGTCPAYDTDRWGDLESLFLGGSWAIGLQPVDDDVRRATRADAQANGQDFGDDVEPFLVGAGFAWDALSDLAPAGYVPNNRATAGVSAESSLSSTEAASIPDTEWAIEFVFGVDATLALTTEPPR